MTETLRWVQAALAAVGGLIGSFIGTEDGLIFALLGIVIADYLTGVILAFVNKKLSSQIGFRGIFKKVLIFVLVGIANMIDMYVLHGMGNTVRTAVIFFYLSNEGISVLENCVALGLPVPEKLRGVLEQLTDKIPKKENTEDVSVNISEEPDKK